MPGGKKFTVLLFLTMTICFIAVYIHKHRQGETGRIDSVLVGATSALQQQFIYLTRGIRSISDHYILLVGAKKESDSLKGEVSLLRAKLAQLGDLSLENQRLREALAFKEKSPQKVLMAHVLAHDVSGDYFGLRLDKGLDSGVHPGMGVISTGGIVGRISKVTPNYSLVQTLIDPASNIDVIIQRSRARGILSGQSKQLQCKMKYLDKLEDVALDDVVVSTDFGGIFPPGLLAGTVTGIEIDPGGIIQNVVVRSAVDIFRLEEVSIVFPGSRSEAMANKS